MTTSSISEGFNIGPHAFKGVCVLAPMAGLTDAPFRTVCRQLGAAMAVSEMVHADPSLRNTKKSKSRRTLSTGDTHIVQILGADPIMMAESAKFHEQSGADVIDINMGCPAKKVLNSACGSALLRDTLIVGRILEAVTQAVSIPVTLKFRTGWDRESINAVEVARIAESCGISFLTLHGRTRADGFAGHAEYDTIARVKQAVRIPVCANGDIDSPEKAKHVLTATGADCVMIGRAAIGNPWIFGATQTFLDTGKHAQAPTKEAFLKTVTGHLNRHYELYGPNAHRSARKHLNAYFRKTGTEDFFDAVNTSRSNGEQLDAVVRFTESLATV